MKYTIILDNDECTGSYFIGSKIYLMCRKYNISISSKEFAEKYLVKGGARPGTKELLKKLFVLKQKYDLKIVMFTAAENVNGWVQFLKSSLEIYGNCVNLFDQVLTRRDCLYHNGLYYKDLSNTPEGFRIMIEDTPENVINYDLIYKVRRYYADVDISHFLRKLPWCTEKAELTAGSQYANGIADKAEMLAIVKTLSSIIRGP